MKQKLLFSLIIVVSSFYFIPKGYSQKKIDLTQANDLSNLDKDAIAPKVSYLKIGGDYISNNVYLGRGDTIITPAVLSSLGYYHKSGLYILGTLTFLPNSLSKKLDNESVEAGYNFDFNDNFGGSLSINKLFYADSSQQVKSTISSTTTLTLNYNISDIITPTLALDFNKNKGKIKNDLMINLGIAHDFIIDPLFGEDDLLTFSPTATINLGSQNFYQSYLNRRFRFVKVKQVVTNAINKISGFQLLDFELSMPINYTTGIFTFSATPTEAFALNKLPKALLNQYADSNNLFFIDLGISLKF